MNLTYSQGTTSWRSLSWGWHLRQVAFGPSVWGRWTDWDTGATLSIFETLLQLTQMGSDLPTEHPWNWIHSMMSLLGCLRSLSCQCSTGWSLVSIYTELTISSSDSSSYVWHHGWYSTLITRWSSLQHCSAGSRLVWHWRMTCLWMQIAHAFDATPSHWCSRYLLESLILSYRRVLRQCLQDVTFYSDSGSCWVWLVIGFLCQVTETALLSFDSWGFSYSIHECLDSDECWAEMTGYSTPSFDSSSRPHPHSHCCFSSLYQWQRVNWCPNWPSLSVSLRSGLFASSLSHLDLMLQWCLSSDLVLLDEHWCVMVYPYSTWTESFLHIHQRYWFG